MLIVTTHASKSMAPRRRSVLDRSMISNLLTPRASRGRRQPARTSQLAFVRDTRTHPATGGGEPTSGMSGAAGGTAGGGGAMYSCAGYPRPVIGDRHAVTPELVSTVGVRDDRYRGRREPPVHHQTWYGDQTPDRCSNRQPRPRSKCQLSRRMNSRRPKS